MRHVTKVGLLVAALALSTVAGAGLDVEFGASVPIGDDGELFVAISSRYFDREPDVVRRVAVRYDNPEDATVAMFIARHSGRDANEIWRLRLQGLSWWQISARFGLEHDVWFAPVRRAPGPPYGKAYGYWKKHRGQRDRAFELDDTDARNLVAARVIADYWGISIEAAMTKRAEGDLRAVMAREYRARHGNGHGAGPKAVPPGHRGKSKGKKR